MSPIKSSLAALVAAVVAVTCTSAALLVSPASAHTDLIESDPQDGAVLDELPREILLEFSEEMEARLSTVNLRRSDGVTMTLELRGGATPSTLVGLVPRSSQADSRSVTRWRTTFRVVSADGHPVTGAVAFGVRGGEALQPEDAGRSVETADVERGTTPSPGRDRGETWPLAVLGGGVLVLLALSLWTTMRLARRNPSE